MVMNPLAGFQQGMEASDAFVRRTMEGLARNRASGALARGDYGAAAETYGRYGMGDQAMQLRDRQMEIDRLARRDTLDEQNTQSLIAERRRLAEQDAADRAAKALAAQQQAEAAAQEEVRKNILALATGLRAAPEQSRAALLPQMQQRLVAMGVPEEAARSLTTADLTNDALNAFIVQMGGDLPEPQIKQFQDTVVPFDPFTGQSGAPQFLPMSPRAQERHNLDMRLGGAKVEGQEALTQQRLRPPAPRGGGGGGGGGGGARPAANPRVTLDAIAAELRRRGKLQ